MTSASAGRWSRRAKSAQALALRSRIVLACADGRTTRRSPRRLGCAPATVGKWRPRFVEPRLDGLVDEPRPGGRRRSPTSRSRRWWSRPWSPRRRTPRTGRGRRWPQRSGLAKSTVGRIWRAFELKPHRAETFKLSTDPLFVEKVLDVVGLYLDPPESAVVLCVDEKTQVQALDRSAPVLPMMPGMPEKRTHDYVRHGITSLFAALDIATGQVIILAASPAPLRRVPEVPHQDRHAGPGRPRRAPHLRQLRHPQDRRDQELAGSPPPLPHALHPHLLLLAQPGRALVRRTHHQAAPARRATSVQALEADIRNWIKTWNENPSPFVWTKTADEILATTRTTSRTQVSRQS